jgi:hypothetical protein
LNADVIRDSSLMASRTAPTDINELDPHDARCMVQAAAPSGHSALADADRPVRAAAPARRRAVPALCDFPPSFVYARPAHCPAAHGRFLRKRSCSNQQEDTEGVFALGTCAWAAADSALLCVNELVPFSRTIRTHRCLCVERGASCGRQRCVCDEPRSAHTDGIGVRRRSGAHAVSP